MGNYLFGQYGLEKVGEAKRISFELALTVGLNIPPVLLSVGPAPLGPSLIDIVTNSTTGTLCPAITFTGVTSTANWAGAITNGIVGVEIADGMVASTGLFIGAFGNVTATSGAGNISLGQPCYALASTGQFSAGVGLGFNLNIGMQPAAGVANLLSTINAAAGTVRILLTVVYLDR